MRLTETEKENAVNEIAIYGKEDDYVPLSYIWRLVAYDMKNDRLQRRNSTDQEAFRDLLDLVKRCGSHGFVPCTSSEMEEYPLEEYIADLETAFRIGSADCFEKNMGCALILKND